MPSVKCPNCGNVFHVSVRNVEQWYKERFPELKTGDVPMALCYDCWVNTPNFFNEGKDYYEMFKKLTLIKSEEDGWVNYYLNNETKEKWVREYPDSDYHGGGSATLKRLEKFPWEE